jgi:hypothetical protein
MYNGNVIMVGKVGNCRQCTRVHSDHSGDFSQGVMTRTVGAWFLRMAPTGHGIMF